MAVAVLKMIRASNYQLLADLVPIDTAAPADVAVIDVPAEIAVRGYRVTGCLVYNATGTPILGQLSLRDAAAGGGTEIVSPAVLTSLSSSAKVLSMTIASGDKTTAPQLFVRLTVANAAAVTVSVKVLYESL